MLFKNDNIIHIDLVIARVGTEQTTELTFMLCSDGKALVAAQWCMAAALINIVMLRRDISQIVRDGGMVRDGTHKQILPTNRALKRALY